MTFESWLGKDNELGLDILNKKYRHNNESFEDFINRVSGGNKDIARLICERKFLFGGRILANRGIISKDNKSSLSNCYVIQPPEDNIESIFECAKKLARTFSYGGGCGIDISKLAPKGAKVNNAAKTSSGAVSFMELFNIVTSIIGQHNRRGALMISLDVTHPDILDFINIKSDLEKITKANISVRVNDDFMQAVVDDKPYTFSYTREATGETISFEAPAKKIFYELAKANWDNAEPGILFWDTITKNNFLAETRDFEFAGVNPCAEEPLPAGGSCLLGSLNLAEYVTDSFSPFASFDFASFEKDVKIAVKALNEVLDEGLQWHPLQEQRDSVCQWCQIGLGIMGLGDALVRLGLVYGKHEALNFVDQLGSTLLNSAALTSALLAARDTEMPVDLTDIEKTPMYSYLTNDVQKAVSSYGLYNSQLLTVAPSGSIATMLGVSTGIEPIFALKYKRKTESLHGQDIYYDVSIPLVRDWEKTCQPGKDYVLPRAFITSKEILWEDRLKMQAAMQKYIDASISSTVNLPETATVEDVMNLYITAWKLKLKGVTVFRENCSRVPVLSDKKEAPEPKKLARGEIIEVDDTAIGLKRKLMTGCGSLHCCAYFDSQTGELLETYLSKGSTGGCANYMVGLSRMMSLAARGGCSIDDIVDQLNSCGVCPSYTTRRVIHKDTSPGTCCPVAVGKALKDMWEEMQGKLTVKAKETKEETPKVEKAQHLCPECE